MGLDMGANREYKNTVFTKLFSDAGTLLELYNALTGSDYGEDTEIEINTLEDILFMDLMNDVSFTVGDKVVVLIEHQATINRNLPLRFLLYIARVYEKIIDKRAVYRQKLMKIPAPEFIVLYNGKDEYPDEKELRLSGAFQEAPGHPEKYGSLDLAVRVLNINAGHNDETVRKSEALRDYVAFVRKVREGLDNGLGLEAAVKAAIKYCVEHHILQTFLTNHASEVLNMLTTEFKMADAIEVWKEEGFEDGLEEGLERGREEGRIFAESRILALLESGHSIEEIRGIINGGAL